MQRRTVAEHHRVGALHAFSKIGLIGRGAVKDHQGFDSVLVRFEHVSYFNGALGGIEKSSTRRHDDNVGTNSEFYRSMRTAPSSEHIV